MNNNTYGTNRFSSTFITGLVLLPAFGVFAWHASTYASWLVDDAGISFAYAKNLASGHGLISQPGSPPVEGFSNPLWTFLIALMYAVDLFSVPIVPKLISHFLVFIGFFAVATSIRKMVKSLDWMIVAGISLFLCATNPGFVIWCVSGLENPLTVCLGASLLLVCVNTLTKSDPVGHTLPVCGGLLTAALALTRPDGIVYAMAFPCAIALRLSPPRSKVALRPMVLFGVSLAIPLGVYLLFRLVYFGDWLPNTYYAKPGTSLVRLVELIEMAGPGALRFVQLSSAILPLPSLAIPIAIAASAFHVAIRTQTEYPRHLHLVTLFFVLSVVVYVVLPGDWMGEFRFGTLAFLFGYVLLFLIFQFMLAGDNWLMVRRSLLLAIGFVVLALSFVDFRFRASSFAASPTVPLEAVAKAYWQFNDLATQLGLGNPSLLVPDLGATLIYSRLRIIDLAGLCDREIGRLFHRHATPTEFSKDITDRIKPDFVHIHGWWATVSGLGTSKEFSSLYVSLGSGNYVRRESLPPGITDQDVQNLYARQKEAPPMSAMPAYPLLVPR